MFELLLASFACEMLLVAQLVRTVDVSFSRGVAMNATSNNAPVIRVIDLHRDTRIKNVAQTVPKRSLGLRVLPIGYDAAIELIDVCKPIVDHEGRELFATHTARTIGEDRDILLIAKMFADPRRKLTEGLNVWPNGAAEMSDIKLIIGPTIQHDRIAPF